MLVLKTFLKAGMKYGGIHGYWCIYAAVNRIGRLTCVNGFGCKSWVSKRHVLSLSKGFIEDFGSRYGVKHDIAIILYY